MEDGRDEAYMDWKGVVYTMELLSLVYASLYLRIFAPCLPFCLLRGDSHQWLGYPLAIPSPVVAATNGQRMSIVRHADIEKLKE